MGTSWPIMIVRQSRFIPGETLMMNCTIGINIAYDPNEIRIHPQILSNQ